MGICKAPTLRLKAHHAYQALSMPACTTIFVLRTWLQNPLKLGTRLHLNQALSMHACISFCSRNMTSKSTKAWYRSIPIPYIKHACMHYYFCSRNMTSKSNEAWYRSTPKPCIKHACMHYCICSRNMTAKFTEAWYTSTPKPGIKHACTTVFVLGTWLQNPLKLGTGLYLYMH